MNEPRVSIIILNWNGLNDTIECLESLKKITYPNYEVIVVDNGSEGDDAEVLKERYKDWIHVIRNDKNYGFAKGSNVGIREALQRGADYVLLLNNDTTVASDMLQLLVETAESDSRIGIVGPVNYSYERPSLVRSAGCTVNWWTGQLHHVASNSTKERLEALSSNHVEAEWLVGAALLVKRSVLESVGLLYESYFLFFEEVELCVQAKRRGYRIVCDRRATVWHKEKGAERRRALAPMYYWTRNRFIFIKRNATRAQFVTSMLYFIPRYLVVRTFSLLFVERSVKLWLSFLRGARDGLFQSLRHSASVG